MLPGILARGPTFTPGIHTTMYKCITYMYLKASQLEKKNEKVGSLQNCFVHNMTHVILIICRTSYFVSAQLILRFPFPILRCFFFFFFFTIKSPGVTQMLVFQENAKEEEGKKKTKQNKNKNKNKKHA